MRSLAIAFSLIRVPKLFVSLLFWPLIIGLFVAFAQIVVSAFFLGLVSESPTDYKKRISTEPGEARYIREALFGTPRKLRAIRVCRWQMEGGVEVPPDDKCAISPNEVALRTDSPADYDVAEFVKFFDGATRKLHVCTTCSADIIVERRGAEIVSNVYSLLAMGIYVLTDAVNPSEATSDYITARVAAREKLEELRSLSGTVYLHPPGAKQPVNVTEASKLMVLIINTAMLAILTLWLSLKGHRKVLDYFARNGALLPLVAACGKHAFYRSLWLITLLRVAFFLLAVLPSTIIVFSQSIPRDILKMFIGEPPEFILWLLGLLASLSSLAIIASIAELKHRHSMVSFMYRYAPLGLALIGSGLWAIALFTPGDTSLAIQRLIASLPMIGVSPIIISPLLPVGSTVIAAHCLFSSALVLLVLHCNSRWFAAHLEEI